jgi:hypothetical protein
MIGLRRAAPNRQGNPIPRTTKSQKRRPLQHEIQKLLRPAVLAADEASMFIELFLSGVMVARYQSYLPSSIL